MPTSVPPGPGPATLKDDGLGGRSTDHVLLALNTCVKLGDFNDGSFELAKELHRRIADLPLDSVPGLKGRCLVAEVYEHRGLIREAQQIASPGGALLEASRRLHSPDHPVSPEVRREELRLAADYARSVLYRERKYRLAREYLRDCLRLFEEVRTPAFPCFGSLAQVNYYLGCAHRQLGEYDAADARYADAIRFALERAVHRANGAGENAAELFAVSRHRAALALGLGAAWVSLTRGQLTRAVDSQIVPAQVLLLGSDDPVTAAYLSLIRGSALRCRAGRSNDQQRREAKAAIQTAFERFREGPYRHELYAAQAAFDLALVALNGGEEELPEAEAKIRETERRAKGLGDPQWLANVSLVRSRISLRTGEHKAAFEHAEAAERMARPLEGRLWVLDAQIARGEALLRLGNLDGARGCFHEVLKGARQMPNPKMEGVLYVHLARSYVVEKNVPAADHWLERWRQLGPRVEHRLVHDLAKEVDRLVQELKRDFTVSWGEPDLTYRKQEADLRKWLMTRARHGEPRKREVARKLGISRMTLDAWEKELGTKGAAGQTAAEQRGRQSGNGD